VTVVLQLATAFSDGVIEAARHGCARIRKCSCFNPGRMGSYHAPRSTTVWDPRLLSKPPTRALLLSETSARLHRKPGHLTDAGLIAYCKHAAKVDWVKSAVEPSGQSGESMFFLAPVRLFDRFAVLWIFTPSTLGHVSTGSPHSHVRKSYSGSSSCLGSVALDLAQLAGAGLRILIIAVIALATIGMFNRRR